MFVVKFVTVVAFLFTAQGGKLHPQWCSFISGLCQRFEDNPTGTSLIYLHYEYSTQDPYLHLLPPIFIWAPLEQFKTISFLCPKFDSSSPLFGFSWMNGIGTERSQPRKIHGRDGVVILVGRVYKCKEVGHKVAN